MADNLLSPKSPAPSGIPPKNIIVYFAMGLLLAIFAGSVWIDSSKPSAESVKKKQTLQEETATKEVGVKGDPKDVSAVADKAGIPAALRGPEPSAPAQAASLSAASAAHGASAPLPPFPMSASETPAPSPTSSNKIDAVRDTEISNAKPIVFDMAAKPDKASTEKSGNPIDRLIDQENMSQAARAVASAKAGDLSRIGGLMAGQQPQAPSTGRAADKSWLKEYSESRKDPGIRPSLPEASLVLTQGSVIEAVTLRSINSDMPGVITARTTRDVYDSTTQRNLVLPRGSLAVGEYSSEVRMGQERLLFAFTRLVLPNGQSFDLTAFNGSDATGRAGLTGDVDNHYFKLFGTSLLIGLLADRVVAPRAVPQGTTGQAGGLSATGQILTDTAKSILEKNREVVPTITIPSGVRLVIEVKRDMIFPSAYRG
jgi:type IV secretory pathway VirB10-like protein